MAALRDIARDFAAEIRDGIGWTIVYRTGRSWNALTIWSDIWNGEWETDDLNDAIGILKADPDAVIVNGYYCGHFGEDMTIDEIAAGIRWHYEGGRNRLADYCEVTQGRDALEEGRKAAEAAGVNAKMIRYYESIDLLPHAGRSESGYRQYSASDLHRLAFIKRARDLGFSLEEVGKLLALWQDKQRASSQVKQIAQKHIANLSERIAAMQAMQRSLQALVGCCHGDGRPDCPILDDLAG